MKIPKYIYRAIMLRAKYAKLYNYYDYIVSDYCDKHNIECEFTHGHVETVVHPKEAAEETLQIIETIKDNKI